MYLEADIGWLRAIDALAQWSGSINWSRVIYAKAGKSLLTHTKDTSGMYLEIMYLKAMNNLDSLSIEYKCL
jgi:hypothetical protein